MGLLELLGIAALDWRADYHRGECDHCQQKDVRVVISRGPMAKPTDPRANWCYACYHDVGLQI